MARIVVMAGSTLSRRTARAGTVAGSAGRSTILMGAESENSAYSERWARPCGDGAGALLSGGGAVMKATIIAGAMLAAVILTMLGIVVAGGYQMYPNGTFGLNTGKGYQMYPGGNFGPEQ